jgi:hypothetical protein
MQPDTLHRLISSPAWVPAGLLPTDPSLITGLHQGLVDGAFAPCPEPPPEVSAQAAGEADDLDLAEPLLESGNSELETGLATLRRFLPDLDLTLDDLPPLTGKLPKNERKISEKSAANTPPDTENNQQYKNVTPNEKNLPKNPECAPKTAASVDRESTRKGGEAQAPPPFLQPQSLRPHLEFPIILTSGCRETPTTNPGLSPSCRRPTPRLPARSLIPHLFSMIRMLLMPAFLRRSRRPALQPCSGNRKPTTEICLFPSVLNIPALGDLLPMTRGWCREPARTGPRRPWMPDFGKPGRYLVQQADR